MNTSIFVFIPLVQCRIITALQNQPFLVKSKLLTFIKENQDLLVESGLLMPPILANVNPHSVYEILRGELLMNNNKEKYKLSTHVDILDKRIQRARYEQFLIQLATVYDGYTFYLPAFLDFRGRIYRRGFLHFHERDLAWSLILFDRDNSYNVESLPELEIQKKQLMLCWSAASHFQSFSSFEEACKWYIGTQVQLSYEKEYTTLIK